MFKLYPQFYVFVLFDLIMSFRNLYVKVFKVQLNSVKTAGYSPGYSPESRIELLCAKLKYTAK